MEVSIAKPELIGALSAVAECIDSRAVMPQLACVHIVAGESVVFETTNLIESSCCESDALVAQEGSALISAKTLQNIAKSLPDSAVTIRAEDGHAAIVAGGAAFDVPALDPSDFPGFPETPDRLTLKVGNEDFAAAAKRVSPFVMRGEKGESSCLRGVHVYVDNGSLVFDATDSYRMCRCCVSHGVETAFDAVVPASIIRSVSSFGRGDVTLGIGGNQVAMTCGSVTIVSRVIEGTYPKMDKFFKTDGCVRVAIDRDSIAAVLKRASTIDGGKRPVLIEFSPDGGTVSYVSSDGGSMREGIECECGERCSIYANVRYMHDSILSIDSETINVMVIDNKPIVIEGIDVHSVVMPMTRKDKQ